MNKNCYRVIFSKALGQFIVVAEDAQSRGKSASSPHRSRSTSGKTKRLSLSRLSFGMWLALGWATSIDNAAAEIVADPSAPGNQQPTVLNAGNGVPLVNIQTPSAGGVSRNEYRRFDVEQQGAILNNSRTDVQTQQGGYVQGNPWLAGGSAKVILNEVNSSDPSRLQGYVEVAGSRADVVIANPAGISCSGCGFINAERATLTTGQAQVNGGSLQGYQVDRGEISVDGQGLDSSRTQYTDLIARSVKINAAVHANELKISTGAHHTDAEHKQITATGSTSAAPAVAIDVAQLGGMYAGKITLVGTEAGVGVRNAGNIGASAGDVVITSAGGLENSGNISSSQNTQIGTQANLQNSGVIYSQSNTRIDSAGDLNNSGTIAAQQDTAITAENIQSSGALAAGIDSAGSASQSGDLHLQARQTLAAHGQNLATNLQTQQAQAIDLSQSQTQANRLTLATSQGAIKLDNSRIAVNQSLQAHAATALSTRGANVVVDSLDISAQSLDNASGKLIQTGTATSRIQVEQTLNNQSGTIASNGDSQISAATLDNQAGIVQAANGGHLTLNVTGQLDNSHQGRLLADSDAKIDARNLNNQQGQITAGGRLGVTSRQAVNNQQGRIAANQDVTVSSSGLDNRNGQIASVHARLSLDTQGGTLDNRNAQLLASGDLSVNQGGEILNDAGLFQAGGQLTIGGQGLYNRNSGSDRGLLAAGGMTLDLGLLDNRNGHIASQADLTALVSGQIDNQAGGQLLSRGDMNLSAQGLNNRAGLASAGNTLALRAASVDNRDTQGGNQGMEAKTLDIKTQSLDNQSGALRADQQLTVSSSGQINNASGLISSLN